MFRIDGPDAVSAAVKCVRESFWHYAPRFFCWVSFVSYQGVTKSIKRPPAMTYLIDLVGSIEHRDGCAAVSVWSFGLSHDRCRDDTGEIRGDLLTTSGASASHPQERVEVHAEKRFGLNSGNLTAFAAFGSLCKCLLPNLLVVRMQIENPFAFVQSEGMHLTEANGHGGPVLEHGFHKQRRELGDALPGVGDGIENAVTARDQLHHIVGHDRVEQLFLRVNVIVKRAFSQSNYVPYFTYANAAKSLFGKKGRSFVHYIALYFRYLTGCLRSKLIVHDIVPGSLSGLRRRMCVVLCDARYTPFSVNESIPTGTATRAAMSGGRAIADIREAVGRSGILRARRARQIEKSAIARVIASRGASVTDYDSLHACSTGGPESFWSAPCYYGRIIAGPGGSALERGEGGYLDEAAYARKHGGHQLVDAGETARRNMSKSVGFGQRGYHLRRRCRCDHVPRVERLGAYLACLARLGCGCPLPQPALVSDGLEKKTNAQ